MLPNASPITSRLLIFVINNVTIKEFANTVGQLVKNSLNFEDKFRSFGCKPITLKCDKGPSIKLVCSMITATKLLI